MPNVSIVMKKITDITPYENNPRINDRAVDVVAESISQFGFKVPIVLDADGVIINGHTRLRAAKRLGMDEVPCIIADDLTDAQVRAFRLMDNKSHEFAEWDIEKLLAELEEVKLSDVDFRATGFSPQEMNDLLDEIEKGQAEQAAADRPELEFTDELLEEHQYVVLYFDNSLDWQVAQSLFDLKTVMALWSKIGNPNFQRSGIGRVVKGGKYLGALKAAKERGELR